MAASILDLVREQHRQARTGDAHYAETGTWIIRVLCSQPKPGVGPVGPDGQATFVLPVAPDRFDYRLPFVRSITAEQHGGVVVERQGMVTGEISISATTGFKLRPQASTAAVRAPHPRFAGQLGTLTIAPGEEISGQLHLWALLNRCFEGYAELCADPDTAPHSQMELHVLKDQLHLVVEPGNVKIDRSAGAERVTYRYSIDWTVLGPAQPLRYVAPDRRGVIDVINDAMRSMRAGVQSLAATVDDLTAAVDSLSKISQGFVGLVDDLGTIVRAGSDVLSGVARAFALPQTALASTSDLVADMAALCEALPDGGGYDAARALRRAGADVDAIAVAARAWHTETFSARAAAYNATTAAGPPREATASEQAGIDRAATLTAGTTATVAQVFGGPYRPGDARRQGQTRAEARLDTQAMQSTYQATVAQGDTIASLAARLLGDARRWVELAVLNELRAPYVTDGAKLPATVAPGDQITVPSQRPLGGGSAVAPSNALTGRAAPNEAALGVDLATVETSSGQWDLAVDLARGATDAETIAGIGNLSQAIGMRLRVERGELPLFPEVGLPTLVGFPARAGGGGLALLHTREQLLLDARILALGAITSQLDQDTLTLELSVVPAGIGEARIVTQVVR